MLIKFSEKISHLKHFQNELHDTVECGNKKSKTLQFAEVSIFCSCNIMLKLKNSIGLFKFSSGFFCGILFYYCHSKTSNKTSHKMRTLFNVHIKQYNLTINSLRNFSNSTDATDVLTPFAPLLFVPFPGIRFNGPRLSRRSSSNCLVSASTLATAKLSSFSFSLNNARIESRSLPAIK